MARFAFVTWDGGGNVPPAVGIAEELQLRGHDVGFIGYEVQRDRLRAAGFGFTVLRRCGDFTIPRGGEPAERLAGVMRHVWASPDHLDDIRDAASEGGVDVLVVDFSMQGALAAGATLAAPMAVLAHSAIAGLVPPPESPMGAWRLTAANQLRTSAGLPAMERLNDGWAGHLTIVTTIAALDPAHAEAAASMRYVGPIFERVPSHGWTSPWDPDDDRPLVLVSFSTSKFWDQGGRIRNTVAALAGEPVRVLVSGAEPADLAASPANVIVRGFVPHGLVLPSTAVTVTHAGHGTVAASLAHGVPVLALPNPAADQPFLAGRLQQLGAGLALDGESDPDTIRTSVQELLERPSYRQAARELADSIRDSPGARGAAMELETLARTAASPASARS
ncbi:MAG TPA: nucleotide disphospho-sugar-binding domain-containing protein [Candidatus Dormibacteraeota bacterium]|jgi:MGT family glycosyltransferase